MFNFPSWDSAQHRVQTTRGVDLRWEVLDEGRVVAMGPIEPPNMFYVTRIARSIGHFAALKGHRYMVEVYLLRDPCGLDAANPRLIVESFSAFSEAPVFFLQATLLLAVLVTVPVLISLVPSALRAVKHLRPTGVS